MSKVSYVDVAAACNNLMLKNEKVTIRKVCSETGGSFNLINEYVNQWREEQSLIQDSDMGLSKEVTNALLAEFGSIAKKVEAKYKKSLDEKSSDLDETFKELQKTESTVNELNQKIDVLQKEMANDKLEFEKKLSTLEAKIDYLSDEKKQLQQKLEEANQRAHDAQIKEAVAKTKAEEIEKRSTNK